MKSLIIILLSICLIQMKADKAATVVSEAKSKVNTCGYVYGAAGQILTEQTLKELKNRHPNDVDESRVRKWMGKQVFDCSGLVKYVFNKVGISIYHGATGAWKNTNWVSKGAISALPRDKVAILYRKQKDGDGMAHTGIYIGSNQVVHAKGSDYGVVKESLPGTWTHYGIPAGLY